MGGIESVLKEFPQAGKFLQEFDSLNLSVAVARYESLGQKIVFSRKYFGSEKAMQDLIEQVNQAYKNISAASIGVHEMGHIINILIAEKLGFAKPAVEAGKACKVFTEWVFSTLTKNEQKIGINKLRAAISKYAKKTGETLSEALADCFANGDNAQILSKAVKRNLHNAFADEFLEQVLLSKKDPELSKKFGSLFESLNNETVRKWYIWHAERIKDEIDSTLSLEEKARKAFELRNEYRTDARRMMADKKLRDELFAQRPNVTFEEKVAEKMRRKNLSYEEALQDIYDTATKTNKEVNFKLGLG